MRIRVDDPAVRELLPRYLSRRRDDIERITGCLEAARYEDIRILAHNMAGSGEAYGIADITQIGRRMETAARENDGDGVAAALEALEGFLTRVVID